MDLRLDDKVALVTGGSKGIGKAIAAQFAAAGARVMISARKEDALRDAAGEMKGEVEYFAANAGDPEQAAACVAATVERLGGIDILVNNAATNPYMGPAIDIDLGRYDKTYQVNLRGPLVWIQEARKAGLGAKPGASVLNISSIGGLSFGGMIGIYDNTKAALIHLTKHLAVELAPGIRVNAIAPGLVKTDFARALWEPAEEAVAKRMPLKRLGEPDDIAGGALYLCSDAASWITGQILVIDGGALLAGAGA